LTATPLKAEQLQSAFEIFNQQSGMLEQSYRELQQTVASLTRQLKKAQSARLAELVKTERLSRHLSHLLETLPGAIIVLDGDGVIREGNSQASALLNQPLIGCSWATIVRREVRDGGSEDGNIQLRDGRWLSLSRRLLQQEPGEVLLLADVTESRRMSQLRQRQERLTTIGEMTAQFAHQVRTPLASAMLYAAQLDTTTAKQQRAAEKITARLNDLGRMVNDMLGFAAGARPAEEAFEVHGLLTEVQAAIEPQLNAQTEFQVIVEDSRLRVSANKDALKGALLNLVTNAIQACESNARIVLGARGDAEHVQLSVTDNGAGIAADVLPRLFEPFFTTRPQGTGLGLAVVQAVAAAHDGHVSVDSSAEGTQFTIRLPVDMRCAEETEYD
jgi:two-component system sensor histidine kinase FlrB